MSIVSINIVSAIFLSYLGLFALNLSMERNAKLVLKTPLSAKKNQLIKALGWMLLALSLLLCILAWGVSMGITAWFGVITLIVGVTVFIQSYQARLNLNLSSVVFLILIGLQFFRL